ncbi:hypothetical protein N7499_012784 [Penicillium canescens]|uniref:Uncharacterized protein n=1 Tax=Penicillium canescens TaxID=5083 RepID=A0AAD6N4U5_PENCN|nr:uncharacterized protein N7446_000570 [Penicillium canescens]KAJ6012247.1 hypothetical protein N7522_002602 [Penicillium canescens]KAJ6030369.1 hypothetical protein N7460_010635 [Penicillium canescens]KAJ6060742.1 hypothetical protein N7444_002596 [Penicillium canescens]KAJ6064104.1 hypothetical protein N7499_012784 [Penicillium canescens]KAJ6077634.1 hypothetical protein N7446_000570 [Penicillium canescens]
MTVHVNDNLQVIAKGSCTTCVFTGAAASILDAPEAGIWEEVLAAHIDLVQAARTPSGFTSTKYGRLPHAFPAALQFQGEGLISDCLVGRARRTEPGVSTELDTLFGEDEHAVTDYASAGES